MRPMILYWGLIAVFGVVHLQALFTGLPFKIPIYVTSLLVISIIYYFYRRILLRISILGLRWNVLLFSMQLLLTLIYVSIEPSWIYIIPAIIFIGIESSRLIWSTKIMAMKQDIKHFEEQREQINETFRVVRSERHDFLKHVSTIHFMLENGENEGAKVYLDNLVDDYEETNLSIKGERGIVAGVLHQMYKRAKASGISISFDLDLPLSTLPISDKHLVTLLGNLLTNSIEACEDWQQTHKEEALLSLQFYKRSGLYILICINKSLPIPTPILDELFHSYGKTSKGGAHEGLGTKMIHDIVNNHQGFLDFIYKNQEFTVKIKIPAVV